MNILEHTKHFFSPPLIVLLSDVLQESEPATRKALAAIIPQVLSKTLTVTSSDAGASKLIESIRVASQQGTIVDSADELLRSNKISQLLSGVGAGQLVETILGSKTVTTAEAVSALSGVKRASANALLSVCVPVVLGLLKRGIVAEEKPSHALINLSLAELPAIRNVVPSQLTETFAGIDTYVATRNGDSEARPKNASLWARKVFSAWSLSAALCATLIATLWYANSSSPATTPLLKNGESRIALDSVRSSIASNETSAGSTPGSEFEAESKREASVDDSKTEDITADTLAETSVDSKGALPATAADLPVSIGESGAIVAERARAAIDSLTSDASSALDKANSQAEPKKETENNERAWTLPTGEILPEATGGFSDLILRSLSNENDNREFVFDRVSFESASPKITAESNKQLNELAKILSAYGAVKIKVVGHTDSSGHADSNKNLSFARAKAVRQYLVKQGVFSERIDVWGEGSNSPVASNDTPEGRAQNRRIELVILKK